LTIRQGCQASASLELWANGRTYGLYAFIGRWCGSERLARATGRYGSAAGITNTVTPPQARAAAALRDCLSPTVRTGKATGQSTAAALGDIIGGCGVDVDVTAIVQ